MTEETEAFLHNFNFPRKPGRAGKILFVGIKTLFGSNIVSSL